MTINDEITIIANQLANAGNKPTVALIKAKLNKQVALPIIISTLKVWQHDPTLVSKTEEQNITTEKAKNTASTDNSQQNISDELTQIKHEIIELKQILKQLIKQTKSTSGCYTTGVNWVMN
jgi:hypothetical protein